MVLAKTNFPTVNDFFLYDKYFAMSFIYLFLTHPTDFNPNTGW